MPETQTQTEESVNGLGLIGAAVAVSAWGVSSVIAKQVDMGGLAVATYRFASYGIVVAALMAARRQRIGVRVMRASMAGGIALGLDVALFFSAIKLTTVANATVIGALQPIVVAIAANRFFGEVIRPRDMALGSVAVGGVIVVVLGSASDAPTDVKALIQQICQDARTLSAGKQHDIRFDMGHPDVARARGTGAVRQPDDLRAEAFRDRGGRVGRARIDDQHDTPARRLNRRRQHPGQQLGRVVRGHDNGHAGLFHAFLPVRTPS